MGPLIVIFAQAHAAGLLGHEDLMLFMPVLPILLLVTIAIVTIASRRGLLGASDGEVDIAGPLVVVAATLSVGAAGIHFAVIQEHLATDPAAAGFFLAIGWFQVIWAMAYLVRPNDALRQIGAIVSVGVIALWLVSRTTGLPFGSQPWIPEPVGMADLFATSFEVVLVGLIGAALLPRFARRVSGYKMAIEKAYVLGSFTVVTVAVLTGLALLGGSAG